MTTPEEIDADESLTPEQRAELKKVLAKLATEPKVPGPKRTVSPKAAAKAKAAKRRAKRSKRRNRG